ncbi:hypothetical protein WI69_14890 [Burkholderia diffusa]|uniref:hypothetical protein n=1 Tax=Burkholderia diffusa TaxID=488732 RepID=UPI000752B267|nr:hypothetical protein [Burkholderia diffusa]KUZ06888.1 hypothetical protein WI28_22400 [Burkholderia diffusa]KVC17593.1 hypothetical protein WI69_14890 [Burkholderia diffusa]
MPVDLSQAGRLSAYPNRPRFWPWWFCIWLACAVLGAAIALLMWPKGERAGSLWFWFCVVGIPNGLFGFFFAIERARYEAMWYRAYHRNLHRDRWLAERIRVAQQPVRVLGVGYCLPLNDQTLAQAIHAGVRLPRQQQPRSGAGVVEHCRFDDRPEIFDEADEVDAVEPTDESETATVANAVPKHPVTQLALGIAEALEPLAASLHALTQYEPVYWPKVRVLAEPGEEALREQEVRDALQWAGLLPLEVLAVPASHGLLVADAWLDARDACPLLVIATAWHDAQPPAGSTEGCVAMLLDAGFYRLPEGVPVMATLHRPVEGKADEIEYGFANAVIWGGAEFAAVTRAWIARAVRPCNRGLRIANLEALANSDAQCDLAYIVGDFGSASGWLAVAAVTECGVENAPHLIIDGVQSAVIRVLPGTHGKETSLPEHTQHDRSETHLAIA